MNRKAAKQLEQLEKQLHRYVVVVHFDAAGCNPNGDPSAGNMPRQDEILGTGLVSRYRINRWIRDTAGYMFRNSPDGNLIYFGSGDAPYEQRVLSLQNKKAYDALAKKGVKPDKKNSREIVEQALQIMLANFIDLRWNGGQLNNKEYPCGVCVGPIQMGHAKSVDPVRVVRIGLTRSSLTNEGEAAKQDNKSMLAGTMGESYIVDYGLYRAVCTINPARGVCESYYEDITKYLHALKNMFQITQTSSKNGLCVRRIDVFQDAAIMDGEQATVIADRVKVTPFRKDGDELVYPTNFADYKDHFTVDLEGLDKTVKYVELMSAKGEIALPLK